MNCQGPCLLHCYKSNSIILLLLGVLIGLCINNIDNIKTILLSFKKIIINYFKILEMKALIKHHKFQVHFQF